MNWDIVKGKWGQLKGKAREEWGDITDNEWEETMGQKDQIAAKLQERYGWDRESAHQKLDDWAARHMQK